MDNFIPHITCLNLLYVTTFKFRRRLSFGIKHWIQFTEIKFHHQLSVKFIRLFFVYYCCDRPSKIIVIVILNSPHELVCNLYRNICTCNFCQVLLFLNELLDIGMIDVHGNHQCTTSSLLRNLICYVTVNVHETCRSRACHCCVVHLCTTWS